MQLLTLWIFSAACAAGYSCGVGLCRHWVRAQIMNSLKENTEPRPAGLMKWNRKATNSCWYYVWTRYCLYKNTQNKRKTQIPASSDANSLESARSTARRARRVTYAQDIVSCKSKCVLPRYEQWGHTEPERRVRRVKGGMAWTNVIDCLSEEEGSDRGDLISGWMSISFMIWWTNPFGHCTAVRVSWSDNSHGPYVEYHRPICSVLYVWRANLGLTL